MTRPAGANDDAQWVWDNLPFIERGAWRNVANLGSPVFQDICSQYPESFRAAVIGAIRSAAAELHDGRQTTAMAALLERVSTEVMFRHPRRVEKWRRFRLKGLAYAGKAHAGAVLQAVRYRDKPGGEKEGSGAARLLAAFAEHAFDPTFQLREGEAGRKVGLQHLARSDIGGTLTGLDSEDDLWSAREREAEMERFVDEHVYLQYWLDGLSIDDVATRFSADCGIDVTPEEIAKRLVVLSGDPRFPFLRRVDADEEIARAEGWPISTRDPLDNPEVVELLGSYIAMHLEEIGYPAKAKWDRDSVVKLAIFRITSRRPLSHEDAARLAEELKERFGKEFTEDAVEKKWYRISDQFPLLRVLAGEDSVCSEIEERLRADWDEFKGYVRDVLSDLAQHVDCLGPRGCALVVSLGRTRGRRREADIGPALAALGIDCPAGYPDWGRMRAVVKDFLVSRPD